LCASASCCARDMASSGDAVDSVDLVFHGVAYNLTVTVRL
jgi:hypothetical protein